MNIVADEGFLLIRAAGGAVGARAVGVVELRTAHADFVRIIAAFPIAALRFGIVEERAFGKITYDAAPKRGDDFRSSRLQSGGYRQNFLRFISRNQARITLFTGTATAGAH
jgi:hypothetical protein